MTEKIETPYDVTLSGPVSMNIERKIVNGDYKNHYVDHFREQVTGNQFKFLDVGANIGLFSLIFSKFADDTSQIDAFEPVPMNISKLWDNIRINEAKNIDIRCFALGDTQKKVRINIPGSDFAESTLASDTRDGCDNMRKLTIQQTSVDQFFNGRSNPDLVKIEAEGAEVAILRDAIETLTAAQPELYLVIHPTLLGEMGEDGGEIGSILDQCGYSQIYDMYAEEVIETDILSNIGPNSHAMYLHVSK